MTTEANTASQAQHSEPHVTLYGRIAANPVGYVSWHRPDLHFSIVIDDAYTGITVIDGQPSFFEAGARNVGLIRSNRYTNALPGVCAFKFRFPLRRA